MINVLVSNGGPAIVIDAPSNPMNNNDTTLAALRNALALRRKAKWTALRLAIRKARSQEAAYGKEIAAALWQEAGKAYDSHCRLHNRPVGFLAALEMA